jgi:hypothetical protein
MPITETDWTDLVQQLNLAPAEDGWFAARVKDFPLAIKIMTSGESTVLLAHVRLSRKVEPDFSPSLAPDSKLAQLVANKTADLSFDSTLAWLTLTNPTGDVTRVFDEFFGMLAEAGLAGTPACYRCRVNQVENVKFYDGRVVQICDPCLQALLKKIPQARPVDTVPLAIVALLGGVAGAMAWALVWIGWDQLFVLMKTDSIRLPRILMALLAIAVAFLTGGPAGWIIKRVPSRTAITGTVAAGFAAVAALFLGEFLYTMVLIYKEFNAIAPTVALRLLPRLWSEGVPFVKLFAAGMTLVVAIAMVRPAKPKLDI